MKSKILYQQKEYMPLLEQKSGRWASVMLVDHVPVPGYSRHAHVLTISVDDGDTQTFFESRTLLLVQANALSIRQAITEFDVVVNQYR